MPVEILLATHGVVKQFVFECGEIYSENQTEMIPSIQLKCAHFYCNDKSIIYVIIIHRICLITLVAEYLQVASIRIPIR